MQTQQQFVSVIEAAQILGITPQTVRVWLKNGRVPSVRLGRRFFIGREWFEAVRLAATEVKEEKR